MIRNSEEAEDAWYTLIAGFPSIEPDYNERFKLLAAWLASRPNPTSWGLKFFAPYARIVSREIAEQANRGDLEALDRVLRRARVLLSAGVIPRRKPK